MKKVLLLCMMCLLALTMQAQAQRCAVLEFRSGVGISQDDVDGISEIFITYFHPVGYTMVERTQIDKAIDEQGFQRSKMTESQMVRIGKILNVSKVVVGRINIVMGQYNVDVRVINVESGTIAATEGETFTASSYRTTMKSIAQKLASQIAITPNNTELPKPSPQVQGYVDLGLPSGTLWKQTNEKGRMNLNQAIDMYGSKLPTKEQFDELRNKCEWEWTGNGMKFIGPNGNVLVLPASGFESFTSSDLKCYGKVGLYWSSSKVGKYKCCMEFSETNFEIGDLYEGCVKEAYYGSIRLCKKK